MRKNTYLNELFCEVGRKRNVAAQTKAGVRFGTAGVTEALGNLTPDFKYMTGASAGAAAEIGFGDYFALQPELMWVQKGFRFNEGNRGIALNTGVLFNF